MAAENISSVQSRTPVTDYKFIEAFKQRAILWDSRLDDYKNTERKNAVWIELSEEVGMTAEKTKARAGSLRSSYTRRQKLIRDWEKAPSGSAVRKAKKPQRYKYAAELAFLNDVTVSDCTTDNLPGDESVSDVGDDTDSMMLEAAADEGSESAYQDSEASVPRRKKEPVKRKHKQDTCVSELTDFLACASTTLKSIATPAAHSSPHKRPELDDDDYLCAMQVYNTLRSIPPCREKEMGRMRLLQDALNLKYSVTQPQFQQGVSASNLFSPQPVSAQWVNTNFQGLSTVQHGSGSHGQWSNVQGMGSGLDQWSSAPHQSDIHDVFPPNRGSASESRDAARP